LRGSSNLVFTTATGRCVIALRQPLGGGHGTPNFANEAREKPPLLVVAASTSASVKNLLGFHIFPPQQEYIMLA
jgi:hypothetical protein